MSGIDVYPRSSGTSSTLAYAEVTANQTGIVTEVDLTGLSVTVTVPAGRRLKITGHADWFTDTANGGFILNIKEGATSLNRFIAYTPTSSNGTGAHAEAIITPTAGTHTYKLTGQRAVVGTATLEAAAGLPAFILVEDISGTVWPEGSMVGIGQLPAAPSCRVRRTTAQSIANSTDTVVSFDGTRWDNNTMWAAGNPTRVTMNTAGVYVITFTGEFAPATDYVRAFPYIRVNGATIVGVGSTAMTTSNVSGFELNVAAQWKFAAGDYLEVLVAQQNTALAARNLQSSGSYSPELTATWLGWG